jgi:FkbM family methyltransferase
MRQLLFKLKSLPFFEWPSFLGFYIIQFLNKSLTSFQKERNEVINFCIVSKASIKPYKGGQIIQYDGKHYIFRPKSSDYAVFAEVMIRHEYSPVLDFIDQEKQSDTIRTIMDVGSNVGFTSLLFMRKFPLSKIFALEPEIQNYHALQANVKANNAESNIVPFNLAAWSHEDELSLSPFRDNREWSFSFSPGSQSTACVKALPLEDILMQTGADIIDLCKIDIEGAEREIFLNDAHLGDFLNRVRYLVMEVHRDVIPIMTITEILRKNNFQIFEQGSLVYGRHN